jgi:intracellular septation protein
MRKNVLISWSIEFGPIALFFLSLYILGSGDRGFLISTAIFITAMIVSLTVSYKYEKRVALFPIISGATAISFGVVTLITQNPIIFILKDTLYNGFFAIFLLVGVFSGKAMLKPLFIALFDMKDKGWYILSIRWSVAFFVLFITNEIAWRFFGQDGWVVYKFWATILTVVFGFYQITLSKKYRNETATKWGMRTDPFHMNLDK